MADMPLRLILSAQYTGAKQALDQIRGQLGEVKKSADSTNAAFASAATGINKIRSSMLGLVSVGSLVALTRSAAQLADNISESADAVGLTIERFQELRYAATQSGVSAEQFTQALANLSKYAQERGIGDINEAFLDVAKRIGSANTAIERLTIATDAFGARAGKYFVTLMQDGAAGVERLAQEARDLGLVMSTETAQSVGAVNDALDAFGLAVKVNVTNALAQALPLLRSATKWIAEFNAAATGGGGQSTITSTATNAVARRLQEAKNAVVSLERGDLSDPTRLKALDEGRKTIIALQAELANLTPSLKAQEGATKASAAATKAWSDVTRGLRTEEERYLDERARVIAAAQAAGASEEDLANALSRVDAQYRKVTVSSGAAAKTRSVAASSGQAEARAAAEAARLDEQLDAEARRFKDLADPVAPLRRELELLDKLLAAGKISFDVWAEAAFQVQERVGELVEPAERAAAQVSEYWSEAARGIQGAMADFLFDPFTDGLQGMLRGFLDVIRRMLAEAAAAQLAQALFGDIAGGKPGGYFGAFLAGMFHGGGLVGAPGPSRLMPELAFVGAPRYATGGLAGLRPNEMPAILHRGEEVLTAQDPRHRANGGASGVRIVNVIDPALAGDYLSSAAGERTILNVLRRNAGAVRQVLT